MAQLPQNVLGHVQVNAVGRDNAYCNVHNWGGTTGSPNLFVDVRCYQGVTGAPVDRQFTVLHVQPAYHLAYVWNDKPTLSWYIPYAYYSSNPHPNGIFEVVRQDVGAYKVTWSIADGHIIGNGNTHVTAYGSNAQCKFITGGGNGSAQVAYVHCYAPGGTRVDSRFMVMAHS